MRSKTNEQPYLVSHTTPKTHSYYWSEWTKTTNCERLSIMPSSHRRHGQEKTVLSCPCQRW